ncbi:GNAT family N-acetyltransferase [Actinoplanes sp. CA-030573]|uniref:GNAT family N-acetyltransferase n=1 Tax=Actinoplanes sp. CA-030573 TaxID=3239898 RepID=UPI003D907D12
MASLFCDTVLAARIERAEAAFMAACAGPHGFSLPVAGGTATYAGPGSPFNKVAGLGFEGLPAFGDIERAYAAVRCPVQVEVSTLGDPEIGALLTGRGYRLMSYENVLGRWLTDVPAFPPDVCRNAGADLQTWLDVVVEAFLSEDTEGVASHEHFDRAALEAAERTQAATACRYLAWRDGVPAGGAAFRTAPGGVAQFIGAATLPAFRRRGVQTALLAARLADARAAGCDLAVVTTGPGTRSQRNVQRAGFQLLYTRAVLVRPAAAA